MAGKMVFTKCSKCAADWEKLKKFLEDPSVQYHGYQASFDDNPLEGLFLFNHVGDHDGHACKSTLAFAVSTFQPKLDASAKVPMAHAPDCPGLCKSVENSEPCPVKTCVGNQIRELLIRMKNYPKVPQK